LCNTFLHLFNTHPATCDERPVLCLHTTQANGKCIKNIQAFMLWVNVTPLHGLPFPKPAIITTYNPSINESLPCSLLPIPLTHTINTHTHHGSRTPQKNHVKLGRAGQIGFRLIPNTLNCIIDHKTERL